MLLTHSAEVLLLNHLAGGVRDLAAVLLGLCTNLGAVDHVGLLTRHHFASGVALLALMAFRFHAAVVANNLLNLFFGNHLANRVGNFLFHTLGNQLAGGVFDHFANLAGHHAALHNFPLFLTGFPNLAANGPARKLNLLAHALAGNIDCPAGARIKNAAARCAHLAGDNRAFDIFLLGAPRTGADLFGAYGLNRLHHRAAHLHLFLFGNLVIAHFLHLTHMLLVNRTHDNGADFFSGLPVNRLLHRVRHHHLMLLVNRLAISAGHGNLVGLVHRTAGRVVLIAHMLFIHRVAGCVRNLVLGVVILRSANRVRNVPHMLLVDRVAGRVRNLVLGVVVLRATNRVWNVPHMLLVDRMAGRVGNLVLREVVLRTGDRVRNVPNMLLINRMAGCVGNLMAGLVVLRSGHCVRNVPHMLLVNRIVLGGGDWYLVALHFRSVHRDGVLTNMLLIEWTANRLTHYLILVFDHRASHRVAVLADLGFGHGPENAVLLLFQDRVVDRFVGGNRNFFRYHSLAYPVANGRALLNRHDCRRVLACTAMRCLHLFTQSQTSQR